MLDEKKIIQIANRMPTNMRNPVIHLLREVAAAIEECSQEVPEEIIEEVPEEIIEEVSEETIEVSENSKRSKKGAQK